jgi:hypothetical protein
MRSNYKTAELFQREQELLCLDLGFPELLIILVIFGAGKLPQVGEALGRFEQIS